MTRLIRLGDGAWVNPGSVTLIVAYPGGEFCGKPFGPRVEMQMGKASLLWDHPDLKTAQAYANHIAGLLNGAA